MQSCSALSLPQTSSGGGGMGHENLACFATEGGKKPAKNFKFLEFGVAPKGCLGSAHFAILHGPALLFCYNFFEKLLDPMISKNALQIGSKCSFFGCSDEAFA